MQEALQFHCSFRDFLLDTLNFIEEQINLAIDDPVA